MKRKGDYQSDTILSEDNDFITLITESIKTSIEDINISNEIKQTVNNDSPSNLINYIESQKQSIITKIVNGYQRIKEYVSMLETNLLPLSNSNSSIISDEKFMINNNYDGAFIVGLNYTSPFFKELETTKIPTVLYDNILNGEKVSTITNDNINTIQRLVTLLAKSGHKKIGFIHADKQSFVANERYAGYIIGLMMNNIEYNPEYVFYGSFSEASGFEASEFFAQRDVTAVVCSSDIIAVGFINGIERFHMTVPKDISVTGYDDLEISRD